MNVTDFDFDLPDELIAQEPPPARGGSRLMAIDRASGAITHLAFADLPSLFREGDLLVVNDTRVFPARLIGIRLPGGGAAECFLVRPADEPDTWIALVHPGQRLREGSRMLFESGGRRLHAEIIGRHFHGRRTVRLWTEDGSPVRDTIDAIGHVPLPPYIKRPDATSDRDRYQTVYARERGSIAAPTAGLHFTPAILDALRARASSASASRCMSATARSSRSASIASKSTRWKAEHYDVSHAAAAALSKARQGRPAHHCGRHDDDDGRSSR